MWENFNKNKTSRLIVPDEHFVRFIQKAFPDISKRKKIKILDAGFASGRHLIYLATQGFDVYGFDYSKESLKFAREWLGKEGLTAEIREADIFDLPYQSNSFDVVVEIGMIEHFLLEQREKAIGEIHRVLKPGGQLFLNVKKKGDHLDGSGRELEKNTFLFNEPSIKDIPIRFEGAYHFFSKADVRNLLKNFRSVELNYVLFTRNDMSIKIQNWIIVAQK